MRERLLKLIKPLAVGLAMVILTAFFALAALHQDGSIKTDVWIDGTPQEVWRVLTATADYPVWNPSITHLSGRLRAGNVIEFTNGSGSDSMVFHPTILAVRPGRELRWKGHVWLPGIFDGEHSFVLEAGGGRTHFIQSEKFTGIFAGPLTRAVLSDTAVHMQAMNRALKLRVEAASKK